MLEAIGMGLADGFAILPPEPGDIDEIRIRIKERCELFRIPPRPGLDKDTCNAVGFIKRAVAHRLSHYERPRGSDPHDSARQTSDRGAVSRRHQPSFRKGDQARSGLRASAQRSSSSSSDCAEASISLLEAKVPLSLMWL